MNRRLLLGLVAMACVTLSLIGCGGDLSGPTAPSPTPTPGTSRVVRFEVAGNFSGRLDATFITASGGGTNESIATLPWSKDITYATAVLSTGLTVGGTGGLAGQTIVVRVLAGGTQVSSTTGTASSSGTVVVATPAYVF